MSLRRVQKKFILSTNYILSITTINIVSYICFQKTDYIKTEVMWARLALQVEQRACAIGMTERLADRVPSQTVIYLSCDNHCKVYFVTLPGFIPKK